MLKCLQKSVNYQGTGAVVVVVTEELCVEGFVVMEPDVVVEPVVVGEAIVVDVVEPDKASILILILSAILSIKLVLLRGVAKALMPSIESTVDSSSYSGLLRTMKSIFESM